MNDMPIERSTGKIRQWFSTRLGNRIHRVWFVVVMLCASTVYSEDEPVADRVIDERTGVHIYFTDKGEDYPDSWYKSNGKIFPAHWYDETDFVTTSIDRSKRARYLKVIQKALAKYPARVVRKNLREVYVLESMRFNGQVWHGTLADYTLYLTHRNSRLFLERVFHHEFSSVLLKSNAFYFSKRKWAKFNPKDFRYGKGSAAFEPKSGDFLFNPEHNSQCVLLRYGKTSLVNDFNIFAENLFLPKPGFRELLDEYPCLRNKRDYAIRFYRKLDRSLNKEFFDRLLNL